MIRKIQSLFRSIDLDPTNEQLEKLYRFYELVVEKNKVMNLTAITDPDDFILKHYIDSLSIVLLKDILSDFTQILKEKDTSILDLGTGGGFPGIPLSIMFPEPSYLLLDSLQKRIRFLSDSIHALSLSDVTALHGRAEDIAHQKKYRGHFRLCTSRAVANLSTLSEYALPFVQLGGYFVAYKGKDVQEEIDGARKAIATLGGEIIAVHSFVLPSDIESKIETGIAIERTLICVQKKKPTPHCFPRKAGIPSRKPLA